MPRTIRTKVFKFNELTAVAKQTAIEEIRNSDYIDSSYLWDEAHDTVKKFHDVFGTKEGLRSWTDVRTSHIDDNLMNLKGLRLRTYIVNNFYPELIKGKYYSLWSKTETSYKHHKEGFPVLKSRHSKVMFERNCPLTGLTWDVDILQPVYEFIDWKLRPDYNSYMDFETLMNDCIQSLEKSIEGAIDYNNSDEGIEEYINSNEHEFTRDGKLFNK